MINNAEKTLIQLFLLQIIVTYFLTIIYNNNFFVLSIILAFVLQFLLLIIMQKSLYIINNNVDENKNTININLFDTEKKKEEMTTLNVQLYKKKTIILVFFLFSSLIPFGTAYYEQNSIKKISTARDFYNIYSNLDGKYYLTNDIDLSDYSYKVDYNKCDIMNEFIGSLDGKGYSIKNLNQELFYCVGKSGQISNLKLIDVEIDTNTDHVGAITKYNYGRLINIDVKGNVKGNDDVGGVVGLNNGLIEFSSFTGNVQGNNNVGGISGYGRTIDRTFVYGKVTGKRNVGGITGWLRDGSITNSYTNCTVIGEENVGGIAGIYSLFYLIKSTFVIGDIYADSYVGVLTSDYSNLGFTLGNVYGDNYRQFGKMYIYEDKTIENYEISSDSIINEEQLLDKNWYINTLYYDENIWDFSVLERGYLPILQNKENQPLYKLRDNN